MIGAPLCIAVWMLEVQEQWWREYLAECIATDDGMPERAQ